MAEEVRKDVRRLVVHFTPEGQPWDYTVGEDGVTEIAIVNLEGLHCFIPQGSTHRPVKSGAKARG